VVHRHSGLAGAQRAAPASRPPPRRPIAVGVVLVLALFLCGAWLTLRSYADLHRLVGDELELRYLSGQLLYLHEQLAQSTRLAAETGRPEFEQRYRGAVPQLDAALRRLVAIAPPGAVADTPTWIASAALRSSEQRALTLVRQDRRPAALAVLTDPDYARRQGEYVEGLTAMGEDAVAQAEARLATQRHGVIAAALLGLALLAALAAAWAWISGLVQQYLAAVKAAEVALADANRQLEERVRARTAELSQLNLQLREEMEQRTRMELELRQAQKLEAVGRLAAGVAHEINTPVQFVSDSCHFLHEGIAASLARLARYRGALDAAAAGRLTPQQAQGELLQDDHGDTDYFVEHMPRASSRALEGLERITQIVRSMKEFSHPGGRGRSRTDLNRAIESTLTIARHEYRYVADVRTEFGDLPPVYCFPGDLNQVVLNLIVNAAHAIADAVRGSERRGLITLRTRLEGEQVVIEVQDDGCGIPAALRERIFEPFFTTKEVGSGTGQGLAIARAVVVDKHGGRLTVSSEPGRGSTFSIRIPLGAADATALADAA